jgi:hypothetical protein
MNKIYTTLLAGSLLVGVAAASNAGTFTFQFGETDNTPSVFSYTSIAPGSTVSMLTGSTTEGYVLFSGDVPTPTPVTPPGPATAFVPLAAKIILTVRDSQGFPANTGGGFVDSVDLKFLSEGVGPEPAANTLLLEVKAGSTNPSMTGTGGTLLADNTDNTGSISGSTGNNVTFISFNSNYLNFSGFSNDGYTIGLNLPGTNTFSYLPTTPFTPPYYLQPFMANIAGLGHGTPPPTTPEPGSVALAVGVLVSFGGLRLRRRK